MQANWSIILNVVLLTGVMIAIFRVVRGRKKPIYTPARAPSLGAQSVVEAPQSDDIIAVRKLNVEIQATEPRTDTKNAFTRPVTNAAPPVETSKILNSQVSASLNTSPIMMFLLAKANRQMAGYELLQAVLAAGLRYGEGNLFHRHQHANGQGPILCSLAAATDEGTFDLQNIGAFSVRGLCLYMHPSGNPGIDAERFDIMLDTAKILSEDLDAHLLDDRRKSLSDASTQRYHQRLNLIEEAVV